MVWCFPLIFTSLLLFSSDSVCFSWTSPEAPFPSTVSRALLELDVALILKAQDDNRQSARVRFLFADSSPSRLINWLWAEHHGLDLATLCEAWKKTQQLITELQHVASTEQVRGKTLPQHIPLAPEVAELASWVYDHFHHHIHMPVALGTKHVDVTPALVAATP